MYLCEDNLVDWINEQNGLLITRRVLNINQYNFMEKKNILYIGLTGYKKVIEEFFDKLLKRLSGVKHIVVIILETDHVYMRKTWLEIPSIYKVFTWNKPFIHPKLVCIPIGLNYNRQYKAITSWETLTPRHEKNKLLCMNCSLSTSPERTKLNNLVKTVFASFCDTLQFVTPSKKYYIPSYIEGKIEIQETNPQCYKDWEPYQFILSPQGAGLDCHRTWEALICGIIPIVKTSSIDELFKDLPVLIVKDWNDINEEMLKDNYQKISLKKENGGYNMKKLYLDYWISKINEDFSQTRETHFITYGNEKYEKAKQRLCSQANQFEGITHVRGYGPSDLSDSFRNKYKNILEQSRGGGYWLWKPFILYNHFKTLKENDILIYLDAGCVLNPKGINRFREYVNILDNSDYGILSFQMHNQIEKWWTTREIFEYFKLDENGVHANSGQYMATVLMIKKNNHSEEFIKKLVGITLTQSQLYTDTHNKNGRQMSWFKDNRHDQSISSLLRKIHGTEIIPRDESFIVPFGGPESMKFPFWAARSKK